MIQATAGVVIGYGAMIVHAVRQRSLLAHPDVRVALIRQIHITGVQALPLVAAVALLFGAIVVTQTMDLLGPDNEVVLKAIVWGGIREVGPLATALIIIVRSSVAIAAEVALMRARHGISDAYWQDSVHEQEVVLPRLVGVSIAAVMLVAYFQILAIGATLGMTALSLGSTLAAEADHFLSAADWQQVPLSLGKAALMGAGIAAVSCHHGLDAGEHIGGVRKAVVSAGLGSLSFVIAVDLIAMLIQLN